MRHHGVVARPVVLVGQGGAGRGSGHLLTRPCARTWTVSHPPSPRARLQDATWLDVCYHSVTAMVGAGVLALPSTMATLGWAAGTFVFVAAIFASWCVSSHPPHPPRCPPCRPAPRSSPPLRFLPRP